jgi:hypothetical protein
MARQPYACSIYAFRYLKNAFKEAKILFTHSYSVSRGISMRAKKKTETSKYLLKMLQASF